MGAKLPDGSARDLAVDSACSCIVQAPAGSGKTTLLVERVLRLLAVCDSPQDILVLTFTNKAANQMLERIASRLRNEDSKLVSFIRWRDQRLVWHLMDNLEQLRVQTIDGFCYYLTQKCSVQYGFSRIVQGAEAEVYYQTAAQRWLFDRAATPEGRKLLELLGFHHQQLIRFLARMLARRDCWLTQLLALDLDHLREQMEDELKSINEELLYRCCFPLQLFEEWQKLYADTIDFYQNQQLAEQLDESQWQLLHKLLAASSWEQLGTEEAKELAGWLLTKEGSWRKTFTSKQAVIAFSAAGGGTSAAAKVWRELKARWQDWQGRLWREKKLLFGLQELLAAPPSRYEKTQWEAVSALLVSLPTLLAYLQLIWQEHQLADYTEITVHAMRTLDPVLNDAEHGLEPLLRWKHLLVDEFQDTSLLHFELLSRLTRAWCKSENSIFLVGDPMQSIYRFRQAEVGIFLWAQQYGMGGITALTNLTLRANFRADKPLLDWINQRFSRIFPENSDIAVGAIGYTPSVAQHTSEYSSAKVIASCGVQTVIEQIIELQNRFPGQEIAILAQTRKQLASIAAALQEQKIVYQATELAELFSDLTAKKFWALMRLVLAPHERWSWYNWWLINYQALPSRKGWDSGWNEENYRTLLQQLTLSRPDGQEDEGEEKEIDWLDGLELLLDEKQFAEMTKWQLWSILIERCVLLGQKGNAQSRVEWSGRQLAILQLFNELWLLPDGLEVGLLEAKLREMYLPGDGFADRRDVHLQLMTMHKAKGLEFDHVIIPELNEIGRRDEHPVLVWQERLSEQGKSSFMVASCLGGAGDGLYEYILHSERLKARHELARLLYVAATRAKVSLRILVSDMEQPVAGSLWKLCAGNL